jgi:glycosyltransferase involved in cell wall biosynthesis
MDEQLSVIMPAYRSEQTISKSVRSFLEQDQPLELVVVDSSPDDRTAEAVAKFPAVRLIRPGTRMLPHAARNEGAAAANGQLLLFTDPDIYAEPGSVAALVAAWRRHGGAVFAAVASHGHSWLERGLHLTKFDAWLPGGPPRPVDLGPSSGLLCARETFDSVGGFRAVDLMIGDALFSWALRDAGVELRLAPEAIFRHDHTQSWREFMRERYARGREHAGVRRRDGTAYDLAVTVTLARPARVVARIVSNAQRAERLREALVTAPLVVSGTLAWFAGETVEMLAERRR